MARIATAFAFRNSSLPSSTINSSSPGMASLALKIFVTCASLCSKASNGCGNSPTSILPERSDSAMAENEIGTMVTSFSAMPAFSSAVLSHRCPEVEKPLTLTVLPFMSLTDLIGEVAIA